MINVQKQTGAKMPVGKERSYQEVVEFLNQHWLEGRSSLDQMKKLDKELGFPSKAVKTIFVGGNNGKSLTIHFTARLLKEEGLKVGSLINPHILTYNERISVNQETINNQLFTALANEVIAASESVKITPHSQEILTLMALLYFKQQGVDVALLETSTKSHFWDPINICMPIVLGITRVTDQHPETNSIQETIEKLLSIAQNETWVVSADQSKLNLEAMLEFINKHGSRWAMPIRKLAPLEHPYEQLHGRCAALAERIAHLFTNNVLIANSTIVQDSLLVKQKGKRGRPTLEKKRQNELNPQRTLEEFWEGVSTEQPGRFQVLEKEKPLVLLDNASNLDGLQNVLLGIKLLHYQRTFKGFTLIIGSRSACLNSPEFAKMIRYFFKKVSGNLIICPVNPITPEVNADIKINFDQLVLDLKAMKVKVRFVEDFAQAFDSVLKVIDKNNGLVAITGSDAIVSQYWSRKGINTF